MYNDITAIILSGGKSSRMGRNKALLKIGYKTIIERVRDQMQQIFKDVVLITNTPDEYKFLDLPLYEDIYKYKGPLAGIHSGLSNSSTNKNFIISCDLPLITKEMIEYLVEFKTNKLITVAQADGYIQQLAGKYSKNCLNIAEEILEEQVNLENRNTDQKKRGCTVLRLINRVGAEIIDAEALSFYKKDLYFNVNKTADYKLLINKISSAKNL
ncbi:MAG: NTP transferase domain-containing protein [Planctomycetia bacterium]|nr:NTP transferase domain-containing protein [Planctomycetia bacterium]